MARHRRGFAGRRAGRTCHAAALLAAACRAGHRGFRLAMADRARPAKRASAGSCLGLRHAFATGRGPVRRLWLGHVDVSRAGGAGRRLARLAGSAGRGGNCRPRRRMGNGGDRRGRRAGCAGAHRAAQCPAIREMAAGKPLPPACPAGGTEPATRLRPSGSRGMARDRVALRHRARLAGVAGHGPGRAAGRLSPDRRGAQHQTAGRRRVELAAGDRRNGRDPCHRCSTSPTTPGSGSPADRTSIWSARACVRSRRDCR